jgi:muramoyltetrapeptide carboxypeptidase
VAVVSPASAAVAEKIDRGCAALRAWGYEPVVMPHAKSRGPLYYAGTVEERLADFHAAFADESIEGVICTRGGWGSAELLPLLDRGLLRANPKMFVGYSDHTSLHVFLQQECGLATVYGPMVAADWSLDDGVDGATWCAAVEGEKRTQSSQSRGCEVREGGVAAAWCVGAADGLRGLREGEAEGRLLGGCLAILEAGLATPWALRIEEPCVLFLEDINVKSYQWDRMLQHLRWAGLMENVRGVVLGDMSANVAADEMELLEAACLHALRDVPGPVLIGLRSGHVTGGNRSVPLGAWVRVDGESVREVG